uniref:Core-2/I-Branching enzyme n=1 Tax=Steinernema glaseri TaxID=37863 RepID=A0A1I8AK92_9BILA
MDCAPFFNSSRSVTTRLTLNTSLIPKTDCKSIRARHHFASMPYSEEEAEYPIAIARVVFRDYYLLEQMLAVQFAPQNSYCYAMDAKSSPEFKKAMRDLAGCFENVHVLEQEFALDSMGHFMNIAHWECAKALHKNPWEYFFMMQNHDIPIKTNLETVRIVKMLNGLNDIESGPFPGGGRVHKNSSFAFEDLELFKD